LTPAPATEDRPPDLSDPLVLAKPAGPRCNLRCAYCYYLPKADRFPAAATSHMGRMDEPLLESFIQQRLELSPGPVTHFEWHGGEPTLAGLEFFRRAVEFQRRHAPPGREVTNGLQTNGLLLDPEWIDFLAREKFSVGLSLDGPPEHHDPYRRDARDLTTQRLVVHTLVQIRRAGIPFDVLCVLHDKNTRDPGILMRFFRELGIKSLQFLPLVERDPLSPDGVSPRTANPEVLGEFLCRTFDDWIARDLGSLSVQFFEEALRPLLGLPHALCVFRPTCGGVLALEHNGDVFACDQFVDDAHRIGNLRQTPLRAIVGHPTVERFGQDKFDALPDLCRACDVLEFCHGACPKDRFRAAPSEQTGLSYLCPAYGKFFRHARPTLQRLALHLAARLPVGQFKVRPATSHPPSVGPNSLCPCGSGRKFKKCCRR
jgi:uncharacterized protein